jgi:membrane associated rhomboid family serine protease
MLDDRSYMRESRLPSRWSVTLILIIVNIVVFVGDYIVSTYSRFPLHLYFGLSTEGLGHGFIWQLLTFQFLHAGAFHLICNLFVIYFAGNALENVLGRLQLLLFYLTAGVIGGLLQIAIFPADLFHPVVGASAGGCGLIAAFAMLFPHQQVTLLLFFILPVTFRARTLLWITIGVAALGLMDRRSPVAHMAHLGGIGAGVLYVIWFVQGEGFAWFQRRRVSRKPSELVTTHSAKAKFWQRSKPEELDLTSDEYIRKEDDPILDKISAQGIHSLTERERKILEAARSKMARR